MWTLADKYDYQTSVTVARDLLKRLREFKPFIYKKSKDHNSVYIHFNGLPNKMTHKLRVSNHEERERYGYKWQLRLDGVLKQKKPQRRYYDNVDILVDSFYEYYDRVVQLNEELMGAGPIPECQWCNEPKKNITGMCEECGKFPQVNVQVNLA